jgi:16S rRNA C967 or C1407 C5-methylase (RsmB/RsmF family)/NOL1/NOP2/fmu family ribosome biogenesis protein
MKQLPPSLLIELNKREGFNEQLFLQAHQQSSVTSVRINSKKSTNQFNDSQKIPWAANAFYLQERPFFAHDPLWHAGAYYVQEASSMFLEYAFTKCVDVNTPLKILDLCAAPGGKSTLLADMISEDSLLISNEVIGSRVGVLAENMMKWGRVNTWVTNSDPKQFTALTNFFDVVVVDAPCSGSGLFRKDDNYITEWTEGNVDVCQQRQQRILHDVLPALKPNGILIYMTCSFSQAENEDMIDKILQDSNCVTIDLQVNTDWGIVETKSEKFKGIGYRFYPHVLQGEGFFLACLRKNDDEWREKDLKYYRWDKTDYSWMAKFIDMNNKTILKENDLLFAMPTKWMDEYLHIAKHVKVVRKGTLLGKELKKDLIPEHDVAMSIYCQFQNTLQLDAVQAKAYLLKEEFNLPNHCAKGWVLLQYQNTSIGWIKNLGNRYNNYYPNHLKIRTK